VSTAEVIERGEEAHHRGMVIERFRVGIRQASQPAVVHAHREVEPFAVRRADVSLIGIAEARTISRVFVAELSGRTKNAHSQSAVRFSVRANWPLSTIPAHSHPTTPRVHTSKKLKNPREIRGFLEHPQQDSNLRPAA
jgi:hypothetical protein